MRALTAIPLSVALLLTWGVTAAVAGDDNPWRMETPGRSQQYTYPGNYAQPSDQGGWGSRSSGEAKRPYYDLGGDGVKRREAYGRLPDASGSGSAGSDIRPVWPGQKASGRQIAPDAAIESGAMVAGRPGNGGRRLNQDYGYAGPDPRLERDRDRGHASPRYGAFPPLEGRGAEDREAALGVEFDGSYYGAFPPLERKPALQDRWQERDEHGIDTAGPDRQSSRFANRPPAPVTDPVPDEAYPYRGYGAQPGYGTGLYGLPYDPLTLGILGPGLLW